MDDKNSEEAEMKEKRIEELEAQLQEAEERVITLREELRREKEKVLNCDKDTCSLKSCVNDKDLPPPIIIVRKRMIEEKKIRWVEVKRACISVTNCFKRLREELLHPPTALERPPTPIREEALTQVTKSRVVSLEKSTHDETGKIEKSTEEESEKLISKEEMAEEEDDEQLV